MRFPPGAWNRAEIATESGSARLRLPEEVLIDEVFVVIK